jgi:cytochrome P450
MGLARYWYYASAIIGAADREGRVMTDTEPVHNWATDYDIFDPDFVRDPYPMWADLRDTCPVPHTERWNGSWMPTRYEDIRDFANDVDLFSSSNPIVVAAPDAPTINAPPISSDPPVHLGARRLILPAFSPRATERHEQYTRDLCRRLIRGFIEDGRADGATDYAQQIPPRVIAHLLGVDEDRSGEFTEWVRGVLELGLQDPELRAASRVKIFGFLQEVVAERRANPGGSDFINELMEAKVDGEPISDMQLLGTCNLLLVAGIDTTWSSIGSALWHLASHPEDTARLVADPDMIPMAVEEFLRAYSPVTMARVVTEDVEYKGCPMKEGDKVLMSFPAANRDPDVFPNPNDVMIDRAENRHIAFGVGIHRCAGSNLARLEMNVAIEEWLKMIPEFELEDPDSVTWAGGQVRGPREMMVKF